LYKKEYAVHIDTKFNIGDQIFVVDYHTINISIDCEICNGTGIIEIKNKKFTCPECNGKKGTTKYKDEFYVIEKSIFVNEVIISGKNIVTLYCEMLDDNV